MIVGLTGRSCSGKDCVASLLDERFVVIDEDKKGHIALENNKEALVRTFGTVILSPEGTINRRALSQIVFSSPLSLKELNSIVHPWMVENTLKECKEIENKGQIAVINAAILEEMGFVKFCDEIILVISDYEKRLERALKRDNIDTISFQNRTNNQKSIGLSLFSSGKKVFTILNNEGLDELSRQVKAYCDRLKVSED